MGLVKISELVAAATLTGTETYPVVQSGVTKKATAAAANTYVRVNETALSLLDTRVGGVGDNATSNDAALTAAAALLPSGGQLDIPPGVYRYSTWAVPSQLDVHGYGSKVSVLRCTSTTGDGINLGADSTNIKLRSLGLDCVTNSSGKAIVGTVAREFVLEDYEIQGFLVGVSIADALNCHIGIGRLIGRGKATANGIGLDLNGNLVTVQDAYISSYLRGSKANGSVMVFIRSPIESCGTGIEIQNGGFVKVLAPYFNACTQPISVLSGGSLSTTTGEWFNDAQARTEDPEADGLILYGDDAAKARSNVMANKGFRVGTYVAVGADPARTGAVRVPNNDGMKFRNAADSADRNLIKSTAVNDIEIGEVNAGVVRLFNTPLPYLTDAVDLGTTDLRWYEIHLASTARFTERSDPAGVANVARVFARDNGSGKTQLAVVFGTGAVQVLATEP